MNSIVDAINVAGRAFVEFALPMLIQSSVLIAILLLVDLVLRRKVRAVFRYWIWLLVLVKLVLPPTLWSPVSFGTWFGQTLEVPTAAVPEAVEPARESSRPLSMRPRVWQPQAKLGDGSLAVPDTVDEGGTPAVPPAAVGNRLAPEPAQMRPNAASESEPLSSLTWQGFALLAWATVAIALLLLLIQRAVFVCGLVAQADPAPDSVQEALDECRIHMGSARAPAVRISANASSPAVCGLLRPVILIPRSLVPRLEPRDLQAVLLHELAHVRRGDLWINLLQTLLQVVYFYNPLLWLANAMIRRVREQAVDEAVLVAMGESAQQYPETLVNIAKLAFRRRPALSLRLIGVVESKSALRSRIKHMLTRPIPKTARLGLLGLLVVIVLAVVLLPMARAQGEESLSRLAILPNCGVWMADVAGESRRAGMPVLDLASERIIELPAVETENDLLSVTANNGRGDILYYYRRETKAAMITFLRSAGLHGEPASNEHEAITITPMQMPFETTVTTLGGSQYEIKITRADEEACSIRFRPLREESSTFKAILPDNMTVEVVGVCDYTNEGKWWAPDGRVLREVPCTRHPNDQMSSWGNVGTYQIAFRFERTEGLDLEWHVPGTQGLMVNDPHDPQTGARLGRMRLAFVRLPADQRTATVAIDIAVRADVGSRPGWQPRRAGVQFDNISLSPSRATEVHIDATSQETGTTEANRLDRLSRTPLGKVADTQGKPIAGAMLDFQGWDAVKRKAVSLGQVTTDSEGHFAVPPVDPGEHINLTIEAAGYCTYDSIDLGRRADGSYWPEALTFTLRRTGAIEGTVLGPDGLPLAGAPLSLTTTRTDGGGVTSNHLRAITDASGHFRIDSVPPGIHLLYYPWSGPLASEVDSGRWQAFQQPGQRWPSAPAKGVIGGVIIELDEGQDVSSVSIDLSKSTCAVEGRVRDTAGRLAAGAEVDFCWKLTNGDLTAWGPFEGEGYSSAVADPNGRYRLDNLPPGDWHIAAQYDKQKTELRPVTLRPGRTTNQDLTLPGRIEGPAASGASVSSAAGAFGPWFTLCRVTENQNSFSFGPFHALIMPPQWEGGRYVVRIQETPGELFDPNYGRRYVLKLRDSDALIDLARYLDEIGHHQGELRPVEKLYVLDPDMQGRVEYVAAQYGLPSHTEATGTSPAVGHPAFIHWDPSNPPVPTLVGPYRGSTGDNSTIYFVAKHPQTLWQRDSSDARYHPNWSFRINGQDYPLRITGHLALTRYPVTEGFSFPHGLADPPKEWPDGSYTLSVLIENTVWLDPQGRRHYYEALCTEPLAFAVRAGQFTSATGAPLPVEPPVSERVSRDTGSSATQDESEKRRVYLRDCETPDVDVVLDLATGQLLSVEPINSDTRYFERLGKGDIVYEYARNRSSLLCLRGATLQRRTEAGVEPLTPDGATDGFTGYYIDDVSARYQVTTAEGSVYELSVLSVEPGDYGGIRVEYARRDVSSPTDEDAGGGADLANSVTIELLGLCKHPSVGTWWDAVGRSIPEPAYRFTSGRGTVSAEYECALVARITGGEEVSAVFRLPSGYVGGSTRLARNGTVFLSLSKVPPAPIGNSEKIDIGCGIAQGQWIDTGIDVQNQPGAGPVTLRLQGGDTVVVDPLSRNINVAGNVRATVLSGMPTSADYEFKAEFTTTDGQVLQHGVSFMPSARSDTAKRFVLILEDVWPTEIAHFRLFYREFTFTEFKSVSLRPSETVRPKTPASRRAYLPDMETPDANVVLDLATGQLLSAEPAASDEQYSQRLDKGDIAYEYAKNKSGLLCLRGARMQHLTEAGVEPLIPDVMRENFVVYVIDEVPAHYQVTTAEGDTYELTVRSVEPGDRGGALVEFARQSVSSPTDEDAGGGVLVGSGEEWGEAVEGIRCRLTADQRAWTGSEFPSFTVEARNDGTLRRHVVSPGLGLIQVDGQWYHSLSGGVAVDLPPGGTLEGLSIDLDGQWVRIDNETAQGFLQRRLGRGGGFAFSEPRATPTLSPGKHVIRFGLLTYPPTAYDGPSFGVVSNPIEIEIVAGGSGVAGDAEKPFRVQGVVTDEAGEPMAGVEVRAACGWMTLMPTGRTVTDANGRYVLDFGPGFFSASGGYPGNVVPQAATISAHKVGYYEANLCRQGNLAMAGTAPGADEQQRLAGFEAVVLPHEPYELNFTMHPGVRIEGELVDARSRPLSGQRLSLTGSELYPSTSVLATTQTDDAGQFTVEDVPLASFWFESGTAEPTRSDSVDFAAPGTWRIRLTYRDPLFGSASLVLAEVQGPERVEASLRDLIDEAEPGDVILVPAGTYGMGVAIDKPLTLRGESAEGCIIEVTANEPAVAIDTQGQGNVTIENLTVKWQLATSDQTERPVALAVRDSNILIRNCRFVPLGSNQRCPVAVRIDGFSNATVDDCRFTGFEYTVCYGPGSEGLVQNCILLNPGHQGVTGYENSTLRVERTIVIGSGYHGLRCTGGTLTARDNILTDNRNCAVYLGNKDGRGTVANNLMLRNQTGVAGFYQAEFAVQNNVIADSTAAGVGMWSTCRLNVRDNVFERNAAALVVYPRDSQDTNVIGRNTFWQNAADAKDCTLAADSILADPLLRDPNTGDFSAQGLAREQNQGLTNPQAIRDLWPRYEQAQHERPTGVAPSSGFPSSNSESGRPIPRLESVAVRPEPSLPGLDASSIQAMIDAAQPGDIVTLPAGVFEERLVIDKPLALAGAGWDQTTILARIDVPALTAEIRAMQQRAGETPNESVPSRIAQEVLRSRLQPVVHVTGAVGVVIHGVKLSCLGTNTEGSSLALPVLRFDDAVGQVTDCAIVGSLGDGIHIGPHCNVEIENTLVAAAWGTGVVVAGPAESPSHLHLHDCDVRNCHYAGVRIRAENDVRIERCRISGAAWHGIRYDDASPQICNNLIFANARSGIYASGRTKAIVMNNLFYANEMCGQSCWFQNADAITGNTFAQNQRSGLEILGASQPTVRHNTFYANPTAIFGGAIGDDSPYAQTGDPVVPQECLFWANERDVQWRPDPNTTENITLGEDSDTLHVDPQFVAAAGKDFSLQDDSPASAAHIGAADPITFASPWPLQPEEIAIIPDGDTRDSRQWKRP